MALSTSSSLNEIKNLKTYTGEPIQDKGQVEVDVSYKGQQKQQTLLIINGNGHSTSRLDWPQLLQLQTPTKSSLHYVWTDTFQEGIGCMWGKLANSTFAIPKFYKARPVPYALRSSVEAKLDRPERRSHLGNVCYSPIGQLP